MVKVDVAIVGGGPAGAMAACRLAEGGRNVVLIEREKGPHHKVCGEFVSSEARDYLSGLGIDSVALGGHPIDKFRLVHARQIVSTALPFESIGLSRKRIDEALLQAAAARGVTVLRGRTVRSMSPEQDGVKVVITDGGTIDARAAILATGKHDLRGNPRPLREVDDLIGLKTRMQPASDQAASLAGFVEIILFDGGYAGVQLCEAGAINLCLVVRRALFKELGNDWNSLLAHLGHGCPHLEERLASARPLLDRPLAIYRIPYGFLHRASADDPARIFRVGDQAAVIPSFCGDGISIALHTGALAAEAILAGRDAGFHHRNLHRDLSGQMRHARMMAALGEGPVRQRLLINAARIFPGVLKSAALATRVARRFRIPPARTRTEHDADLGHHPPTA
jgi:menaquinone-9 beta-reductase